MKIYRTHRDPEVLGRHLGDKVCVRGKVHGAGLFAQPQEDSDGVPYWGWRIACNCCPLPPILGPVENPLLEEKP